MWHLVRTGEYGYKPFMMALGPEKIPHDELIMAMFDYYLNIFFTPVLLLFGAIFSALVGYILLRAAGAANKEVIPRQDYELISKMLIAQNESNSG